MPLKTIALTAAREYMTAKMTLPLLIMVTM